MTVLTDASARADAIDPLTSFCVSAPAGSGKTELLIQRYLRLLSRVSRPEQVLAITFTRKAAAEMRERVMQALQSAQSNEPCCTAHQQVTRSLAEAALAADTLHDWGLLRDSSRYNIKTIDSFCAGLARQMPVLSQIGGQPNVQDDATALYAEAVLDLYALLDEAHPVADDLEALLLHFDNDWDRLRDLLTAMLACREQWGGYIGVHHAPVESEAYLIVAVESLVGAKLQEAMRLLAPYASLMLELLRYTARNLSLQVPAGLPGNSSAELPDWHRVADLLLTANGQWRKSVSRNDGFPGGTGEYRERKEQWQALSLQLQGVGDLRETLLAVRSLPAIQADSVSWRMAVHLSRLLPTLAAQLLLVFRRYGVVDHSHVAQSALLALGDDEAPTELSLRLDYQIEHLLVDEFQDTAITQFELLHKLTRGWGEHNQLHPQSPRTLMIVGDGMQSIYGFRGANVGLFLRARREGFNGVPLQPLELHCNFRSDAGLVNWVNQTFQRAFPARNDASRWQVSYSLATAVRPMGSPVAVQAHAFTGQSAGDREVKFVCDEIAAELGRGSGTIAVLGRNRRHLQPIIQRLKRLQIPCSAPELHSLAQSAVVVDMLTLCRALSNDFDRLAWAALLRAPWCGLSLADLLVVVGPPHDTTVWARLQDSPLYEMLSADGRNRLQHILPALRWARQKRDRLGLRVWIERTWESLGGPACAAGLESLRDAESFLQLLEEAEATGAGLDLEWLSTQVGKRFMAEGNPEGRVQVLTLHKAKGLEFDTVIVTQLDRLPRRDERDILLWDEHTNADGERAFLLAADDHSPAQAPTLYNYLRQQRRQKMLLENTRLLYVGATRAIRRLLLTAGVTRDTRTQQYRDPPGQSLLRCIWPTFQAQMQVHECHAAPAEAERPVAFPPLIRLRRSACPGPVEPMQYIAAAGTTSTGADNHLERSIGTVVHLALEELARRKTLPETVSSADERRWRVSLRRLGLSGSALESALQQVLSSVIQSLRVGGDGRWVLARRAGARSEWALTVVDSRGEIRDIIVDRSFVDPVTGERWVIDYKNSRPSPGETLHAFTTRQGASHLDQLRRYRDAVSALERTRVRCALFFTALGVLHVVPELDLPTPGVDANP